MMKFSKKLWNKLELKVFFSLLISIINNHLATKFYKPQDIDIHKL